MYVVKAALNLLSWLLLAATFLHTQKVDLAIQQFQTDCMKRLNKNKIALKRCKRKEK